MRNYIISKTLILFIFFSFSLFVVKGQDTADFYVSPTGDDNNQGTIDQPFRTIEKAYSVVVAGDLVYFRGGHYYPQNPDNQICMRLNMGRDGTEGHLIKFWAYPGEIPIIDLSQITFTGGAIRAIFFTGDYWHWKGFEVAGLPPIASTGVHIAFNARGCNYCIFESLKVHDNNGLGFTLSGIDGIDVSTGNLVLNCDGYRNQDPGTTTDPYGNADGIHIGTLYGTSSINIVRGCRAWDNSDDGFDSFNNNSAVIYENCWSFHNGYKLGTNEKAGDGVGFKLGGATVRSSTVKRELYNCFSFANDQNGFDENFDTGDTTTFASILYNCSSYHNGPETFGIGFKFGKSDDANIIRNCVSYMDQFASVVTTQSIHDHNSWDIPLNLSAADFQSLDWSAATGPRKADGSLPDIDFMKPSVGSYLLHAGVDVGLPYTGSAPNLGPNFGGAGTPDTLQSLDTQEAGSKNPDAVDANRADLMIRTTVGDTATYEGFVKFDISSVNTDYLVSASVVTWGGQHNPAGESEINPYWIDMYGTTTTSWPDSFTWNNTRSMNKSELLASVNIQGFSGGYAFGGTSVADWIKARKLAGDAEVAFRFQARTEQRWAIWISGTWKGEELALEYGLPESPDTIQSVDTKEAGSKLPNTADSNPADLMVRTTTGDSASYQAFVKFDIRYVNPDSLIDAAVITYGGQHNPNGESEINPYWIDMYGCSTVDWPEPFTWNTSRSMQKSDILASANIQAFDSYTFGGKSVADWIRARKAAGATEVAFRFQARSEHPWDIWLSGTWKGEKLSLIYGIPEPPTQDTLQSVSTGEVVSKTPDEPDAYPIDALVGKSVGDTASYETFIRFDVSSVLSDKLIDAAVITWGGQHNPTGVDMIDPYWIDLYGCNTVEWPDPFTWNSTRSMDKSDLLASANIQEQKGGYIFGGTAVSNWITTKIAEGATEVTFRYEGRYIQPWEIWLSGTWKGQELALKYETADGIKEVVIPSVSYYPNPVRNELSLSRLSSGSIISVYSISGVKVIETQNGNNLEMKIEMNNFQSGIYIVRIISGNSEVQSFKVVKN